MSSSLLSATVRRLLLDRIEATIYSWTVSGDSKNAAMHVHVAAFPYLDVTKISIRQPCLNFAIYSSHMLPRRLDVLLVLHTCTSILGTLLALYLRLSQKNDTPARLQCGCCKYATRQPPPQQRSPLKHGMVFIVSACTDFFLGCNNHRPATQCDFARLLLHCTSC